jgi:hypothetical protein
MNRQKSAEAIVVAACGDEGPNSLNRTDAEHSMPEGDADKKAAMPEHARRVGGGTAESRGGPWWNAGATRQRTGRPDRHPDTHVGKSGEARGKESRLTLGGLVRWGKGVGMPSGPYLACWSVLRSMRKHILQ